MKSNLTNSFRIHFEFFLMYIELAQVISWLKHALRSSTPCAQARPPRAPVSAVIGVSCLEIKEFFLPRWRQAAKCMVSGHALKVTHCVLSLFQ